MADPISSINRSGSIGPASAAQSGSSTSIGHVDQTASSVPAGNAPTDSADVSNTAGLLDVMVQAGATASAIDEARVQALHDAIANGTFTPDPQQVAQKLLDMDAALSGGGTS